MFWWWRYRAPPNTSVQNLSQVFEWVGIWQPLDMITSSSNPLNKGGVTLVVTTPICIEMLHHSLKVMSQNHFVFICSDSSIFVTYLLYTCTIPFPTTDEDIYSNCSSYRCWSTVQQLAWCVSTLGAAGPCWALGLQLSSRTICRTGSELITNLLLEGPAACNWHHDLAFKTFHCWACEGCKALE